MANKQPLSDFRAVRRKLPLEVFMDSEGMDVDPTDLGSGPIKVLADRGIS
jgi:hypothetical protein